MIELLHIALIVVCVAIIIPATEIIQFSWSKEIPVRRNPLTWWLALLAQLKPTRPVRTSSLTQGSQRILLTCAMVSQLFIITNTLVPAIFWGADSQRLFSFGLLFLCGISQLITFFDMNNYLQSIQAYRAFVHRALMLEVIALSSVFAEIQWPLFFFLCSCFAAAYLAIQWMEYFVTQPLRLGAPLASTLPLAVQSYFRIYLILDNLAVYAVMIALFLNHPLVFNGNSPALHMFFIIGQLAAVAVFVFSLQWLLSKYRNSVYFDLNVFRKS